MQQIPVSLSVLCPPLNIHFPLIYLHQQIISEADSIYISKNLNQDVKAGTYCYYSLDPKSNYGSAGKMSTKIISKLEPESPVSLCLRYHETKEEADAYLDGFYDSALSDDDYFLIQPAFYNDIGVFTLVQIPTRKSWGAPNIVHIANIERPVANIWVQRTYPDGSTFNT